MRFITNEEGDEYLVYDTENGDIVWQGFSKVIAHAVCDLFNEGGNDDS